jgi:hypothetical protein
MPTSSKERRSPPIDRALDVAFTEPSQKQAPAPRSGTGMARRQEQVRTFAAGYPMVTILVILIICWVVIRVIDLVKQLWSMVSAESSPDAELAAAA